MWYACRPLSIITRVPLCELADMMCHNFSMTFLTIAYFAGLNWRIREKKLSFDLDSLRSHTLAMSMCVCVWLRFVARARDNKMGEILPTKIGQSTLLSRWSTVCDHHFSVPKSCFGFLSFSHDLSQFCYFWTLNLVNCVLNVCFPFIHWPFWAIPWAEFRQKKNGNWCRRKSDMVRVTLMRCRRSCTCVLCVRVQQA